MYYVFDVLYLKGFDLRSTPLAERKRVLEQLLEPVGFSIREIEGGNLTRFCAEEPRTIFPDGSQNLNSQSPTIVRVIPSVRLLRYCYPNSVEIHARISAC
jgi:hypothetical protein